MTGRKSDALARKAIGAVYTVAEIMGDIIHGICFSFVTGVYEGLEGYIVYEGDDDGNWTYRYVNRKKRRDSAVISDDQISKYVDTIIQDFRREERGEK